MAAINILVGGEKIKEGKTGRPEKFVDWCMAGGGRTPYISLGINFR